MTGYLYLLGIPRQADSIRDWIVWCAAVVGGVVAIGVGFYKISQWARDRFRAFLLDILQPELAMIGDKMDTLKTSNDAQHAHVAAQIAELRSDLTEDRQMLAAHMDDAAESTAKLHELTKAVDTHVTKLREDLTDPGFDHPPSTPPRPRFGF